MLRTLAARLRHEPEPTKGSRFIATVAPADSDAQARALVDELRSEMPDASHHCAAWRIAKPSIDRAADDGEPSGSAGRPILAQLTGRDLVDVCVVVTRYFGGTKLGVGGLVRAYGGAAAAALDLAELVARVDRQTVVIEHGYPDGPSVEHVLTRFAVELGAVDFGEAVRRSICIEADTRDDFERAVADATSGRASVSTTDADSGD